MPQSLADETVTLRERDTTNQQRLARTALADKITRGARTVCVMGLCHRIKNVARLSIFCFSEHNFRVFGMMVALCKFYCNVW